MVSLKYGRDFNLPNLLNIFIFNFDCLSKNMYVLCNYSLFYYLIYNLNVIIKNVKTNNNNNKNNVKM